MIKKWNDKELMTAAEKSGFQHVQKICYLVERGAKMIVPVDTGQLRRSITTEVEINDKNIVGRVGTNVKYAPYVELGTRKMSPRPYLRPALYGVIGYKGGTAQEASFESMVEDFVRNRA